MLGSWSRKCNEVHGSGFKGYKKGGWDARIASEKVEGSNNRAVPVNVSVKIMKQLQFSSFSTKEKRFATLTLSTSAKSYQEQ